MFVAAMLLSPVTTLKVGRGPGTESPAAAKPLEGLLLLTQYRLIVTSNSGAASIAGATPFAGRLLTLPRRASIGSIASRGIARSAVLDEQNAISTPFAPWPKLAGYRDSSL